MHAQRERPERNSVQAWKEAMKDVFARCFKKIAENREEREVSQEGAEKTGKWRKPKKKTTRSIDGEWETVRKDVWLRELLNRCSEDEGEAEERRKNMRDLMNPAGG